MSGLDKATIKLGKSHYRTSYYMFKTKEKKKKQKKKKCK